MLNQLLRFTLVSGALLWLRPRWKGLLALVGFVALVHVLHGEYLGYVQLSGNDEFLVWSFVLKWLALIAGVVAYFFLAVMRSAQVAPPEIEAKHNSTGTLKKSVEAKTPKNDGFDFLRQKKQLKNRAEQLIERDPAK